MAYHKRPLTARLCAHCHAPFEAAHKARMYCSNSCNTLACRSRKASPTRGRPVAPPPSPAASLTFDPQTLAVLAAGQVLGQFVWSMGARLVAHLSAPAVDPGMWLPAAVRAAPEPSQWLHAPDWPAPRLFAVYSFHGQCLCYRAADRLLLWASPVGEWVALTSPEQLAALAPPPVLAAPRGAQTLAQLVNQYVPDHPSFRALNAADAEPEPEPGA